MVDWSYNAILELIGCSGREKMQRNEKSKSGKKSNLGQQQASVETLALERLDAHIPYQIRRVKLTASRRYDRKRPDATVFPYSERAYKRQRRDAVLTASRR